MFYPYTLPPQLLFLLVIFFKLCFSLCGSYNSLYSMIQYNKNEIMPHEVNQLVVYTSCDHDLSPTTRSPRQHPQGSE